MSDINNSETSKLINQIYFELHGGDKIKQISRDINDALKQIRKEADLANQSADKVIKKFTTLGQMSPQMSNISSAIYSKQEKRRITNIARTTHSTERYKDYYSEGTVDYNAARLAWKQQEAEKKKQVKLNQEITNFLKEYEAFESKLVDLKKKEVQTAERIRKMTEYQQNKINVARERNVINAERNAIREKERLDRRSKNDRLAGYQNYKSEHPELFTVGGLLHSKRYQTGRALSGVGSAVSSLGLGGKLIGGLFDSLGTLVKSPIAGAATAVTNLAKGVIDLGRSATQAFAEIESIKTQLGVVFSNQTQADSMFGQISQYAVKSPFGVQQTSELAVLLKQSGVYASDLMDTLKMLGDTAGGNMEKMKRIANNYAQIVSIGKASMLDMRQFAYAGIPIFEAVSKELGVSQQQLRKLISDGKVTSDIIEKVFKDLTGINGIFENATEKGAKTLKARLQNLSDARQLAFGGLGEWGANFGTKTGGDSYANKMITWAENFYSWIKDNISTVNIQKDVATIANRNDRIEILKKLIEENKNNKELRVTYEKELQAELAKIDLDANRLKYSSSYDAKIGRLSRATEALSGYSLDNAAMRFSALSLLAGPSQGRSVANLNPFAAEYAGLSQSELEHLQSLFKELIEAMQAATSVTEEDIKANRESAFINAQQLAFDQENRNADRSDSLNSKFQELLEIQREDEEYKRREEEKKIKALQAAQSILKKLVQKADETGSIDFTKFSMGEFLNYSSQGAFSAGKKFNIVNGNKPTSTEDMSTLKKQVDYALKQTLGTFYNSGDFNTLNILSKEMSQLNGNLSDTDYLDKLSDVMKKFEEAINSSSMPAGVRQQMISWLGLSTISHELTVGGENANPNDLLKGSKYDFVPLWKRILAGATGLSTQGMTGTLQTMENYKNDMAIRNMTSSVLSATMKSMGVDTAMDLVRTSGNAKQLRGDNGYTYQVDWQKTRESIKQFSLALSASTEVVTAYKNSLEQELDTYQQLIAAGYTEAESQDLKNQKTVSAKTLEKLSKDAGDQLVNAFGEGLKTKSGKTAFFNGTEFVDEHGNKLLEEEIVMTGKLFDFIKEQLPRLADEIADANIAELNNSVLSKMLNNINGTQMFGKYLQNAGYDSNQVNFLNNNPDYLSSYINAQLTRMRAKSPDSTISRMSNESILAYGYGYSENKYEENRKKIAALGNTEESRKLAEENRKLLDSSIALEEIFKVLAKDIDALTGTDFYKDLFEKNYTKERDDAVHAAFVKNKQINEYGLADPTNLKPRDYGGIRGMRNWMQELFTGESLAYDKEDFIAETMRSNKDKYGLSDADLEKSNEALASMLSLSQQIMIVWDKGANDIAVRMDDLAHSVGQTLSQFLNSSVTSTFETWGEALGKGADASEELENNFKKLGSSLLSNLGTMITEAGLSMAIHASSMPGVIAGLGLAAAGGAASWLGGYIGAEKDNKNSTKDETAKLEALKSDLQKLLEQARTDALYYENNLRHKNALGINRQFSEKSVHDAVITPKGDVVTTDPKDYLIATKQPQNLIGGGNVTVQPIINNTVVNNTSARVRQEQTQNADGSIDILTIIEDTVGQYIASSKSDAAFEARDYRRNGRQAVM